MAIEDPASFAKLALTLVPKEFTDERPPVQIVITGVPRNESERAMITVSKPEHPAPLDTPNDPPGDVVELPATPEKVVGMDGKDFPAPIVYPEIKRA